MTKKDKKLIYEFCGFKEERIHTEFLDNLWLDPISGHRARLPSLDANFYFKYAMPKLKKWLGLLSFETFMRKWLNSFTWRDEDPVKALGEALPKLIRGQ